GQGRACTGLVGDPTCLPGQREAEPGMCDVQAMGLGIGRRGEEIEIPFVPLSQERKVSFVRAIKAKTQGWAAPHRLPALQGVGIASVSAGGGHTAFLTMDGRMFLCGEGAALAGADPVALEHSWTARLTGVGVGAAVEAGI
ncbi:unnamed protein product, partial [Discosporangium mesarthrocarpum]